MFVASLIAIAAASCERGLEGPADPEDGQVESSSAALDQAASPAAPAPAAAEGKRLDREQLVQLLGDRVPAGVGSPCIQDSDCPAPTAAPLPGSVCGGYSSECDSSGTQPATPVHYSCLASNGSLVCTAVAEQTVITIACGRQTNGNACGTFHCNSPVCQAYPSTCAESTTQVQTCFSAGTGVCSNDSCINQASTQSAVGSCSRDTDGVSCGGRCSGTGSLICNSGTCRCLSGNP